MHALHPVMTARDGGSTCGCSFLLNTHLLPYVLWKALCVLPEHLLKQHVLSKAVQILGSLRHQPSV